MYLCAMSQKEFLKYLDNNKNERLRVRLIITRGIIASLVYQYESLINNKWVAIVRYDTSHGFFHRDFLYPNGKQEKYSIEIENLRVAASYAEQDIKDRWEYYKNKYIKKLKK